MQIHLNIEITQLVSQSVSRLLGAYILDFFYHYYNVITITVYIILIYTIICKNRDTGYRLHNLIKSDFC